MRSVLACVLTVASLLASAGSASAAVPRIVIVSGHPLRHRIVIADWQKIFAIFERTQGSAAVGRRELANRPSLCVSLFWGPGWSAFLRNGGNPRRLRPRDADQHGRFYPRHRGRAALLDVPWAGSWPRRVPRSVLDVLRSYGVPAKI